MGQKKTHINKEALAVGGELTEAAESCKVPYKRLVIVVPSYLHNLGDRQLLGG